MKGLLEERYVVCVRQKSPSLQCFLGKWNGQKQGKLRKGNDHLLNSNRETWVSARQIVILWPPVSERGLEYVTLTLSHWSTTIEWTPVLTQEPLSQDRMLPRQIGRTGTLIIRVAWHWCHGRSWTAAASEGRGCLAASQLARLLVKRLAGSLLLVSCCCSILFHCWLFSVFSPQAVSRLS